MALLCSRAIYEDIALVCVFADKLKPLCEAADYAGIDALVKKAVLTSRIPSIIQEYPEEQAPQILNQIDKMTRRYPKFRKYYDHLSDFIHPNTFGTLLFFWKGWRKRRNNAL